MNLKFEMYKIHGVEKVHTGNVILGCTILTVVCTILTVGVLLSLSIM